VRISLLLPLVLVLHPVQALFSLLLHILVRLQPVVRLGAVGGVALLNNTFYVFDKQRVEQINDFLALGHEKSPLERNPDSLQVHGADFDDVACFFGLENAVSPATGHLGHI